MSKPWFSLLALPLLAAGAFAAPAQTAATDGRAQEVELGFVAVDEHVSLRRMVARSAAPKGTVLLLHGFPETLYAWEAVAGELAGDFDVHAFDWPGYGQSSRPPPERFAYSPQGYARVLRRYVEAAGIDRSRLIIYATDIGALPVLLAALEEPGLARTIIVGDFAPLDRPQYMYPSLQALKAPASAGEARRQLNSNRDEILENAFRRGHPKESQFALSSTFRSDMARGWNAGRLTTADAFANYYAQFSRDQHYFEAHVARLKTPVRVVWGELDLYIDKAMGAELAARTGADLLLLPGTGHYPHLQDPRRTAAEIRAAFR